MDDEELKKDSKIRRTKTTIRLRKRKKIPRRSSTVVDGKHTKLPSIMQDQTVKKQTKQWRSVKKGTAVSTDANGLRPGDR